MSIQTRSLSILGATLCIVGAFVVGWYTGVTLHRKAEATVIPIRVSDSNYPLISPLVGVSLPATDIFPELSKTQRDVQRIVDAAEKSHAAEDIGVYFRIPANAHAFGIHADNEFDPGSLIKVPVMIAYLKGAEANPAVLKRMLSYTQATGPTLPNALPSQLPSGRYSAQHLIEAMIIDSDNTAKDILLDTIKESDLQDVFDEMSITFLKNPNGTISPKQYITFFSRLYSAAFLNREQSNRALELLTQTSFKDGLVAGLPTDVLAAHKYGERGIYVENTLSGVELHDCGIIYASSTPYYLCVMTRGTDVEKLAQVISSISATVYNDRESFSITP